MKWRFPRYPKARTKYVGLHIDGANGERYIIVREATSTESGRTLPHKPESGGLFWVVPEGGGMLLRGFGTSDLERAMADSRNEARADL